MGTVAEDGDILVAQGLKYEVGYHPSVVFRHAGAIGVEDADDTDIDVVLTVVVHHQGFGHPFAFVVAAADADRVDVAPVVLFLGMMEIPGTLYIITPCKIDLFHFSPTSRGVSNPAYRK